MDNFNMNLHQDEEMLTTTKARENAQNRNKRKRSESEESEIVETKRSTDEPSPLKIENILETIFGFLDANSIKAARQVNKLFSSEGAKVLLAKCFVKLPSDLQSAESSTKDEIMAKFKAFLANKFSDVSMIPKITVTTDDDLELWKSLGVLGPQVNSIKLTNVDDQDEFLKKLLDLLPNLKFLNLVSEECWFNGNEVMKILTLEMSKPEKDGKPLIISGMSLRPDSVGEFEELEKFADCSNIKFEELRFTMDSFPPYEARMATTLSKLLSTSQNTLKNLALAYCENFLSLIQFPCITTLNKLQLFFSDLTPGAQRLCRFPPGFQFSENVPNIDEIFIGCGSMRERADFLAKLFKGTGKAYSVKHLTYMDPTPGFPVDRLLLRCRRIDRFCITLSGYNEPAVFHSIFKHGKTIKSLEICINLNDFSGWAVTNFDSILTGFAPETVDWIKKIPVAPEWIDYSYSINNVKELRVNPSILDLEGLKILEIRFTGTSRNALPKKALAFAGQYAFKMMSKDVKIDIQVDGARAAFDEVSKLPNVTVKFVKYTN